MWELPYSRGLAYRQSILRRCGFWTLIKDAPVEQQVAALTSALQAALAGAALPTPPPAAVAEVAPVPPDEAALVARLAALQAGVR